MVKKIFAALFFLGGVGCAWMTYLSGGPAWGDSFDFEKVWRDQPFFLLGTLFCLFCSAALIFQKKPMFQRRKPLTL